MIIGVVGPIASGKSVLAEMLKEQGFYRLSFSDEVREETRKRGLPIERTILQDVGNEMRAKFGTDYWARRLIKKMLEGREYVVEGIRNPGEIDALRNLNEFVLIGFDAPIERRYEWIIARNKDSDPKTIEGIVAMDARDRGEGEGKEGQQVAVCYEMADYKVMNDGTLEQLKRKVMDIIEQLD